MKIATSLSMGDREMPLEASRDEVARDHSLVGDMVEVSRIAGGDLKGRGGEQGEVTGVYLRFGSVVGYEVKIERAILRCSLKDVYLDREYLEDIQPLTATSASLQEGLAHWEGQRDYWLPQTSGLEAFCFALASVTPQALPECHSGGWKFLVPCPMPGDRAVVDCRAVIHGKFWSLGSMVYPERLGVTPIPNLIEDHWARVFTWTHYVARTMCTHGFPWEQATRNLEARAKATTSYLRPLVNETLQACLQAKQDLTGEASFMPPGSVSVAFSSVRLKAGTVGLVEPPTDRRPYSVVSISPGAARDRDYLQQVILHECLHIAVGSNGGKPHNELFIALAEKLELRPEHRD